VLDFSVSTRRVAGIDVAADSDDATLFYALPPEPRATVTNGAPDVLLLRLIEGGKLTGGNFQISTQLIHDQATLDKAAAELQEQLKVSHPLTISPVPVKQAVADLQFVGKETTEAGGQTPLLRRAYGRSSAMQVSPHTARFSIWLTPEGVTLMESALRAGAAPMGLAYLMQVEGLWPAQRIVARVDWGRVYDHFSVHQKEGYLFAASDIQKITEDLIETKAVSIQVVQGLAGPPGSGDDGTQAALAWIQREMVERFCEPVLPLDRQPAHASLGTMGEMFGVGSSFAAKQLKQVERAVEEIDFQQQRVLTRTITSAAHAFDLLAGADPVQCIADGSLTHPFFQRMTLNVRSAQPLPSLHLKEAVVQVTYGTEQAALRLTPEVAQAHFECWADASPDRTWSILPQITFADDSPLEPGKQFLLAQLQGGERELTLDLKSMAGIASYTVAAPVDPRIALSELHVTHSRSEGTVGQSDLAMASQPPSAPPQRQTVWFRDMQLGDSVTANLRYMLTDGRIVAVPAFRVDTEVFRLPAAFPGVLTVQIISDDDWTNLDQVIVAIQKQADSQAGTFVFAKPSQVIAVNLDMPDPSNRKFRYRMTRIFTSGVQEADDWVETDIAVVIAGSISANRLVVDVTAVGPELPQAGIKLIQVELSYVDAEHQVRDEKTVAIGAKADHPRWEVAIQDPQKRSYEYRTTIFKLNGSPPQVGHWTTSTDRTLAIPVVANGSP
jgi:hypothetical protein